MLIKSKFTIRVNRTVGKNANIFYTRSLVVFKDNLMQQRWVGVRNSVIYV